MRPDAHKRERSRRYLAKQRSKYGGAQGEHGAMKSTTVPRKSTLFLPSNAQRYDEASSSKSEDEYDITSVQELDELFSVICPVLGSLNLPEADNPNVEEPCRLYSSNLDFDSLRVARILAEHNYTETELQDLPQWFTTNMTKTNNSKMIEPEGLSLAACVTRLSTLKRVENTQRFTAAKEEERDNSKVEGLEISPKTDLEDWLDRTI